MGNPAVIRTASASGGAGPAAAPATGNDAAPAQRTDFLATLAAALGGDAQEAVELIERRAGEDEPVPAEEGDGEDAAALLAGLLQLIAPAHRPCTADKLPGTGNSLEMMHGATRQLLAGAPQILPGGQQAAPDLAGSSAAPDSGLDLMQQLTQPAGLSTRELIPELRLAAGAEFQVAPGAGTSASATQAATSAAQLLRSQVGSPRWAEELGSRLVLMSSRGQHEGSLTLSPEHLGPLEVRISVQQNNAQVWFGAQHADTRAALAEALPRLREMFAEAGLSLGQAGVSQEAPRRQADPLAADASFRGEDGMTPAEPAPVALRPLSSALLDLYA